MLPLTRFRKRTRFFGVSGPSLALDFVNGGALDPQITFTRASSATYFDDAGTLQSAAINVPRLDYNPATLEARGLLIEEQRTNSIRNNTMQGAVAGTPGTEPTNWASSGSGSGVTREIVGVGTENGIAYADVRFYGTPTAGTSVSIGFEQTNQIVATAGQTWTESVFVKLQAGSFTNISTVLSLLATNGVSGTEAFNSTTITSTPADLQNCRLTISGTLAAALGTTHVQPRIRIGYTVGAAFDITFRIGLPQLELGAFATSVIPTTTTALTRAADVASVNTLSPWFNATSGTLFSEYVNVTTATGSLFSIDDGTTNNRIIEFTSGGTNAAVRVVTGGFDQVSTNVGAVTANTIGKLAFAYATNDFAASVNGAAVFTDTSGTVPSGLTTARLGTNVISAAALNGWLRRISYYPRRLSNAGLQSLTTP